MITLLFFATIFVIVIYHVRKYNKIPKEIENMPYISAFPLIWALLRQKPHDEIQDVLHESSKGRDIYLSRIGPAMNVNISSPEHVKDLLMESEDIALKFEYGPGNILYDFFGNGLVFSNGDKWRTYRKLATPAFNNALSPEIVGETVMDLFSFIQQNLNRPIDIFEVMQRTTIEVLGKLAFGYRFGCLESGETPHIINVYKYLISTVESVYNIVFPWINKLPTEHNRKFRQTIKEFDGFIFDIIEAKRNQINNKEISDNDRVDLLTSMLKSSEQEGIHADTKQLRDEMVTFFVAGHDTTSMSLSTSLYYLAKYPEMQEKARAEVIRILGDEPVIPSSVQLKEMKYINAIIKESLRVYPPAPVVSLRSLQKPIKIGPYIVPKNVLCSVNIWQVHYDTRYWENPKQYNPERFLNNEKRHPFSWIPFSAGPRNCIGQNFSIMEQRVILSMMLLKYNWTLPKNSINEEKLLLDSQFLLRPVDLKLVFTERK
ncbi:cytochrome P450 [Rhizophagus irregularis DAOM 181602=DAOM 197198]|uniref:Dit2p n=4 Tax=Rhizophagus irregularis TaxID=588596 RepID=A0A015MP11_RHIIW|nr:cytochrome P450 [Rhizophagus irregularis DAOM 181602=DAOM 197198]EXX68538.1 Dit2p [Rhizophagus irregularis DAOM 197198w]POG64698.1 cytochrome P450 [Rhizophagus irregularis DAOM 181602=DAOM 197198]|eukprot:XP_025171564.1 cytochrome P450 [Rhizophagus irregularis DAOM 181602=DAOM 197198]